MAKQISDYSVTLYHVGNQMLVLSREGEKRYTITCKPHMVKPTKAGFVMMDDSRIKAADLMVFKNANREIAAEFYGWCLPEQVEEAKLAVAKQLRAHLERHRDLFIMMLGALESPKFEELPNHQDDQMRLRT